MSREHLFPSTFQNQSGRPAWTKSHFWGNSKGLNILFKKIWFSPTCMSSCFSPNWLWKQSNAPQDQLINSLVGHMFDTDIPYIPISGASGWTWKQPTLKNAIARDKWSWRKKNTFLRENILNLKPPQVGLREHLEYRWWNCDSSLTPQITTVSHKCQYYVWLGLASGSVWNFVI